MVREDIPRMYKKLVIAGSANAEVIVEGLTSTEEEPRTVLGVYVNEVTGTENNDADILGYHENENKMNYPIQNLLADVNADVRDGKPYIPLNWTLLVGELARFGVRSEGTATNLEITIEYAKTEDLA